MTDSNLSASAAVFVEKFLLPFWQVRAEPVQVAGVLGASFAKAVSGFDILGSELEAFYEQVFHKANAFSRCDVPWPHADALVLSVAAHDLIALADPRTRRRTRRKFAEQISDTLALLPPLERFDQIVVRAATCAQFDRCARQDRVVRFWAGRRVYHGRDVPKRLVAFPTLRRVRQHEVVVALNQDWPLDLEGELQAFFQASPLTWLSEADRSTPSAARPDLHILTATLQDHSLRAFIAQTQCTRDLSWLTWFAKDADERLARALDRLCLELKAYGADHPALESRLEAIPEQRVAAFFRNIETSRLQTTRAHWNAPTSGEASR